MGSNTVRNLTWGAVAACIIALFALIKQSSTKKQDAALTENSSIMNSSSAPLGSAAGGENTINIDTSSLSASAKSLAGSVTDAASSAAGAASSAAGAVAGAASSAVDAVAGGAKDIASQYAAKGKAVQEEQTILPIEASATKGSASKTATSGKGAKAPAKPVAKFDAGGKTGDFMVVAGTYASKDNANTQMAKLQKLGFANAESVKFENTANYSVVAASYGFRGTADAAVRTLAKNKVSSFVRKRSGEVFKPSAPTAAVKPAAPAVKGKDGK